MKQYVLFFRMDVTRESARPTPEQRGHYMASWTQWIDEIIAKGQPVKGGNHLSRKGILIRSRGEPTNGP